MSHAIEVEIERNFAAFKDMLDDLMASDEGKYALLRDQKLEGIFSTPAEAERAGFSKFADECYSIQLVSEKPIDLGNYPLRIRESDTGWVLA